MKEELWKTVNLFLLWCLLFSVAIIGIIVGGRVLKNDEIMNWTMLLGFMLIAIVFFGKSRHLFAEIATIFFIQLHQVFWLPVEGLGELNFPIVRIG